MEHLLSWNPETAQAYVFIIIVIIIMVTVMRLVGLGQVLILWISSRVESFLRRFSLPKSYFLSASKGMLNLQDGPFPVYQNNFTSVVISEAPMGISLAFSVRELRWV